MVCLWPKMRYTRGGRYTLMLTTIGGVFKDGKIELSETLERRTAPAKPFRAR